MIWGKEWLNRHSICERLYLVNTGEPIRVQYIDTREYVSWIFLAVFQHRLVYPHWVDAYDFVQIIFKRLVVNIIIV